MQIGGRFLSTIVTISPGIYLFYFPYLIGVPMALWWGPRVFIAAFVASAMGAHLAGIAGFSIFLLATAELSKIAMGWAAWTVFKMGQRDLIKTKNLFCCWLACFALPNIFGSYAVMAVLALNQAYPANMFFYHYVKVTLIDTLMGLLVSFPLFIFLSNSFSHRGWAQWKKSPFR
ncbi:hypothetical protein [Bdellovibrio svalbardensis]|uniref:ECF transporter S component n=1 Tax=Bdellovibrio svalbardensis TaxID=2972972 RepID=A0ABT6DF86_9BACT|nr:hypothetical protein [Bdellovibrio svalbardensis]MDG0815500.1 hypothetical protein [Bdellovibrio svalbardensis]